MVHVLGSGLLESTVSMWGWGFFGPAPGFDPCRVFHSSLLTQHQHSTGLCRGSTRLRQLSWPTLRSVYVFQWQGTRWITRVLWGSQYSPVTSFNVTCSQFQSSKALLVCCFFFVVVSLMSSEKVTVTIFKIYFCSTLIDVSLHWQLGSGSLCNWDNILNKEGESIAGAYQELRCVSQLTKQTKLNYIQHNRYSDVFWEWW